MEAKWVMGDNSNEGLWALVRGPLVYAADTVWLDDTERAILFIGDTEKLIAGFILPEDIINHVAKVFVWDGTNIATSNMIPFSDVVVLK